jgi:hypothetical protein
LGKHRKPEAKKTMEKKNIGIYQIKFMSEYDSTTDKIFMDVSINQATQQLIKSACVEGENPIHSLHSHPRGRHKVKGPVYSSIQDTHKDLLFETQLVNTKSTRFLFDTTNARTTAKNSIKSAFRQLSEVIHAVSVEETTTFRPREVSQ